MKSSITIPGTKKLQIIAAFVGILILFGISIYFYYAYESRSLHDAAAQNIQAIADLKINQIEQWRRERISNARTTFQSPLMIDALEAWLRHREDAALKQKILERLSLVKREYTFADIFMVSPEGEVIISLDGTSDKLGAKGMNFIEDKKNVGDIIERDFFISSRDSAIHYDIIAPIRNSQNGAIGYLVFRSNPIDYLYPLVRRWPVISRSSETILVRKDGDSVLFLNDLRFQRNAALRLRIPLSRKDLPAVQAVLGVQGIFDGYDYRGVHTLAYLAPIPNTPWRMVAKIDYSEILSELTYRSIILVVIAVIMTLLFVALAILYYRSHERRIYDALLENEEKYRMLFEQAYDGIFIVDAKGRILDVNPSGCAMLGYTPHELFGRPMNDLYYGMDRSTILAEFGEAHAGESLVEERLMIRKDGTHVPVEFSKKIMPDGKMQKIIRDITDRKLAEKELLESKALLAETEKSGKIGGWSFDPETLTQTWTEETFNIFEFDLTHGEPKVPEGIDFYAPSSRPKVQEAIQRAIEFGEAYDQEWEIITQKGNRRWVHVVSHVHSEHGKVRRLTGSIQDITERKEMEQLLRDVQRREAIGILSAGVAHDFNNLLAVMMGNVSFVQTQLSAAHPMYKHLENTIAAINRSAELTSQILAYSGKGKNQITSIDIAEEIRQHVSLFNISTPKNVALSLNLPSTPVYLNGDPGQLKQIIMNLIANGAEAIGDKHGEVSVVLSEVTLSNDELREYGRITNTVLKAGRYAFLEVSDTGSG